MKKFYYALTATYYANRAPHYLLFITNDHDFENMVELDAKNGRLALLLLEKRFGRAAEMSVNQFCNEISYKTIRGWA